MADPSNDVPGARARPAVRRTAQVVLVVCLIVAALAGLSVLSALGWMSS